MNTIILLNGYFVEVDDMNSTLKKRYTVKKTRKEAVRVCGHFKKPVHAIEKFVRLNRVHEMEGMELSMDEYIEALNQADRKVVEFLKTMEQKGVWA